MFKRLRELFSAGSTVHGTAPADGIEGFFGVSRDALKIAFKEPLDQSRLRGLPAYPKVTPQVEINAVIIQLHISFDSYARCLNSISDGFDLIETLYYKKGDLHTFIAIRDELGGKNLYILTNALELIGKLASLHFGPLPPWELWPHFGPFHSYRQGPEEYWFMFMWGPFWSSLTVEEQDQYFEVHRKSNKEYISDADWEDWKLRLTFGDKRRGY